MGGNLAKLIDRHEIVPAPRHAADKVENIIDVLESKKAERHAQSGAERADKKTLKAKARCRLPRQSSERSEKADLASFANHRDKEQRSDKNPDRRW